MKERREGRGGLAVTLLIIGAMPVLLAALPGRVGGDVDPRVIQAEKRRVEIINKVKPAVVAIFAPGGNNGGSGVLISEDGFALTNFHVTSACGITMKCGLPDGVLYDAVLVGQDKVGDVALIKLIPKRADQKFPFVPLGDSDQVRAGDWSLAMGNPFLLATDFSPTVTFGLISGVNRYQYPEGTLLEYTDCIQIDTSINPGNSGGPLFNMDGELIGINGRGSFEKRGRVNSGVGYAISINQIKNFLGQLAAGLDCDHASLGATMESESEEGALARILVRNIIDSDARRRGLDVGDQLILFVGRPMTTVNQFKNVLGLFPRGWRVPLVFRRGNERREILVRLMGVQRQVLEGAPPPGGPKGPVVRPPSGPAAKYYRAGKAGFTNMYFNDEARDRTLSALRKHGDFSALKEDWTITAKGDLPAGDRKAVESTFVVREKGAGDGTSPKVQADIGGLEYSLEPLNPSEKSEAFKQPTDSGGLLLALYQYRNLLTMGPKGFVGEFSHGGTEPFYTPPADPNRPAYMKNRTLVEVIRTRHAGVPAKWFFAQSDDKARGWKKGELVGFEVVADREEDPCEVYLGDYREVAAAGAGRRLPHRIEVRKGDARFALFTVTAYRFR